MLEDVIITRIMEANLFLYLTRHFIKDIKVDIY